MWSWVKWRPRSYEVRTCFGARMRGHSLDLVQGYVYYFGVWEPNLTAFLSNRLAGLRGRTFVDVGANVGYFSLLAATRLHQSGSVVSIEAFPSIYEKLVLNLRLNDATNVRAIHAAASDRATELELFHAGPFNEGGSTSVRGRFNVPGVKVRAAPLGDLLTSGEIATLRIMKVDVEGAEWAVVSGLLSVLEQVPADAEFVVEIGGPDRAHEARLVFDAFVSRGYLPYCLTNRYEAECYIDRLPVSRPTRMDTPPSTQTDVVFSRLDLPEL